MADIEKIKVGSTTYTIALPLVTCSIAAGTQAKTATVTDATLIAGLQIRLQFTNGNSHASPTLNLNSLGAKSITGSGSAKPEQFNYANSIMNLVYDGTNWIIIS